MRVIKIVNYYYYCPFSPCFNIWGNQSKVKGQRSMNSLKQGLFCCPFSHACSNIWGNQSKVKGQRSMSSLKHGLFYCPFSPCFNIWGNQSKVKGQRSMNCCFAVRTGSCPFMTVPRSWPCGSLPGRRRSRRWGSGTRSSTGTGSASTERGPSGGCGMRLPSMLSAASAGYRTTSRGYQKVGGINARNTAWYSSKQIELNLAYFSPLFNGTLGTTCMFILFSL